MRPMAPLRRGAPVRIAPAVPLAPRARDASLASVIRGGSRTVARVLVRVVRRVMPLAVAGGLLSLVPLLAGAQGAAPGGAGSRGATDRVGTGASGDTLARGRAIFAATCRTCHTVLPPGQGAPPMSAIARRYRSYSGSVVAAQSRIAEWLFRPDAEKSLLPREERERYGLMPHQPLADAGRFAVAAYVVTLADSMPRPGRGRGAGPTRR